MATGVTSEQRRSRLVEILRRATQPVTGSALSKRLRVSRQVIVNDVAILRAGGEPIVGSPQGYLMTGSSAEAIAMIAVRHDPSQTEQELQALVDHGLVVLDVVVEHSVYGEVRANLMIESRADIDRYRKLLKASGEAPLSSLTGGLHLHTVRYRSADALDAARRALRDAGILFED
jgi:transcriptional regulator of NAD metabolism